MNKINEEMGKDKYVVATFLDKHNYLLKNKAIRQSQESVLRPLFDL